MKLLEKLKKIILRKEVKKFEEQINILKKEYDIKFNECENLKEKIKHIYKIK